MASAIAPERQLEVTPPIAAEIGGAAKTPDDDDNDYHASHETHSTADGNEVVDQLLPGDSEDIGKC